MRFIFVFCVKLPEEYISLCFSSLTGSGGRQLSAMGLMPVSQLESVFAITVILMMAATASVNFTSKLNTFFCSLRLPFTPQTPMTLSFWRVVLSWPRFVVVGGFMIVMPVRPPGALLSIFVFFLFGDFIVSYPPQIIHNTIFKAEKHTISSQNYNEYRQQQQQQQHYIPYNCYCAFLFLLVSWLAGVFIHWSMSSLMLLTMSSITLWVFSTFFENLSIL